MQSLSSLLQGQRKYPSGNQPPQLQDGVTRDDIGTALAYVCICIPSSSNTVTAAMPGVRFTATSLVCSRTKKFSVLSRIESFVIPMEVHCTFGSPEDEG